MGGNSSEIGLPEMGQSWVGGGLFLNFRKEGFEVGEWKKQRAFFIIASVLQWTCILKWCFVMVYGPMDHSRGLQILMAIRVGGYHE
jgi:hypothetical protein